MSLYRMWLKNQVVILGYVMHRIDRVLADSDLSSDKKLVDIKRWIDFYKKSNDAHDKMQNTEEHLDG